MSEQYQLERWTGREYVPHGKPQTPAPGAARRIGDTARMLGLPRWRVVRVDKDRSRSRPRAWRPTPSRATGRSAADVRAEYLAWAQRRGLERVTMYRGDAAAMAANAAEAVARFVQFPNQREAVREQAIINFFRDNPLVASAREVDPADFLGPAPDPETIEEC